MKRFTTSSVLYRYLVSFVSITVLSCAIIGMISYFSAARELRKSAEQEQQKRLLLAAEDINAQFDQLQEIAYRVQTSVVYSPAYVGRNPYYEVELVKDFKKFSGYSSVVAYYFLHYEGNESIFTSTGKAFLSSYSRVMLDVDHTSDLQRFIDECDSLSFYPVKKGVIAIFPINMTSTLHASGKATMNFFLTREALLERARLVSGENFNHMAIYCDGACVLDCDTIQDAVTVGHEKIMLVFDKEELVIGINNHFLQLSLWMVLVCALILCILAVFAAIRNYRPIGILAHRHNMKERVNELDYLDRTLTDIEGQLRLSQEELTNRISQFKVLRDNLKRHFAVQMVHGSVDEQALSRIREAGLHFSGHHFHAYLFQPKEDVPMEKMEQLMEELSDDSAAFFVVPYGGKNSYAVVVNTDHGDGIQDILQDVCCETSIYHGGSTESIRDIPALLFDALTKTSPSCIRPADIARCREDEKLHLFRKMLDAGDETKALESLREYCAAYAGSDLTVQQLIHNNIVSILLSASYEANMSVPYTFIRGKYDNWSLVEGWVSAICSSKESVTPNEEHHIIQYLREHMLDYNLSLESTADHFHCSTRQVARVLQAEVGMGYREFVSKMRMEHAKSMLRDGYSVAEVCETVCYVSRSNFIKAFTNYTGMTPTRYREHEKSESSY